jgi:hypothetical protein
MEKHRARCLDLLRAVLEMEKVPFTQNTHYLEASTEKWLSKYKDARAGKGNGDAQAKVGLPTEARPQAASKIALTGKSLTSSGELRSLS